MQRTLMKSKIHRAKVTRTELEYEGSCAIDVDLLRRADIWPNEQIHVLNLRNGARGITYAIEGAHGEISLNGAIAHIGEIGDEVIIVSYASFEEVEAREYTPVVVHVDNANGPTTLARLPVGV